MGRYIKNIELGSSSYSIRLPLASSAIGPDCPVDGLVRYNINTNKVQFYSNNSWKNIAAEGVVLLTKDSFMGDGGNTDFGPMSFSYENGKEMQMLVFVGNVFQNPGVAFQVYGNIIRFSSVPGVDIPIIILHGYSSTTIS